VEASSSEIKVLMDTVERWYRRYLEIGDVSSYFLFKDDLEVVDHYATLLLRQGKISDEEYFRFVTFCDEKLEMLKSELKLSDEDVREVFG